MSNENAADLECNVDGKNEPVKAVKKEPTETDALLVKPGDVRGGSLASLNVLGGFGDYLEEMEGVFGYKLLVLLHCVQHLQKGFASAFADRGTPYIYKAYHVPAPTMQIYGGITGLPWALKPIIGLVSDVLPWGGYNKAPYILLTSMLGAAAFIRIGTTTESSLAVGMFVVCLFLIQLQTSTADLLSEAKYAESMQKNPAHGPSILSYVWFGLTLGGLLATLSSGPVLESFGPRSLFLVSAIPATLVLVPVAMGYLEEKQLSNEELAVARERYYKQKEACALCVLMLCGTCVMITCSLVSRDPFMNCVASICVAMVMLIAFSVVLNPVIAKANAFALIQTSLGFSTGGASFYFYTDTVTQYPEGPHFSDFFYNSVLGVVGSVVSLIGIYCYQKYMTTWKYRSLLIVTNIAISIFSMFDIMMFARINVQYGIPDHILVLGLSVFEGLIAQWQWMPQVVILSYLCPEGMEATMYALLAGCHNMGNTIASNCGALLLGYLDCMPSGADGESAQFENLWKAALISTVLPLVAAVLLINLMPDARQNERIVTDANGDATAGSLWKRWTGSSA